jgi:hypothetical protein
MRYIHNVMDILQVFKKALGLYVNWGKTKAAFISPNPRPTEFDALGWDWEHDGNATKLLGIPVAQHISKIQTSAMVRHKLEERLQHSRKKPTSLVA